MITQFTPISKILVFLINVTGVALIITVLMEDIKLILKRIFIAMNILIFVWVDLAFLARLVDQTDTALLFIRIAWSITPLLFVLVYSFIVNFLGKSDLYRRQTIASYVVAVLILVITLFTRLVIRNTMFEEGILNIVYGDLVWAFFGTVTVFTIVNFYLLIKYCRDPKTPAATRSKTKILLGGLSIFFIANAIFNIILPVFFKIFHLYEFGDYTTVVFISLIAYAVVTRRFFGTKVVAATFVVSFLGGFQLLDALIFSNTWEQGITKSVIFLFYIPFGYLLVKSVLVEVKQRKELQELTQKLRELDKQKDEFISMAAHELRAPMTAIKGYLSMIIEGDTGKISNKARGYLTDATAINDRLVRLVNNMLNVSRIEEGRMVYQLEIESLSAVARTAYATFRPEAERKGLDFKLEIPKELKDRVKVDPDRIHEVLANLLSNSIKYTEEGSVTLRLSQPSPETIRSEVVDTGPGVSKEEQEKLFNKFYRAESMVGKTTGTGLGLYICKLLVEKFGGSIGVNSEVGKGSNFWFELPLVQSEPGAT